MDKLDNKLELSFKDDAEYLAAILKDAGVPVEVEGSKVVFPSAQALEDYLEFCTTMGIDAYSYEFLYDNVEGCYTCPLENNCPVDLYGPGFCPFEVG